MKYTVHSKWDLKGEARWFFVCAKYEPYFATIEIISVQSPTYIVLGQNPVHKHITKLFHMHVRLSHIQLVPQTGSSP